MVLMQRDVALGVYFQMQRAVLLSVCLCSVSPRPLSLALSVCLDTAESQGSSARFAGVVSTMQVERATNNRAGARRHPCNLRIVLWRSEFSC